MRTVTRRPRSDGRAERDAAIARVDQHAPGDWKQDARQVVCALAREQRDFTTDDVWDRLTQRPPEPRALGAVMVWARNYGFISATDGMRESERPEAHRNPKRVWRSNVFDAQPGEALLDAIERNWRAPRDVPAPRHTAPDAKSLKRHEPKPSRRRASSKPVTPSTPRPRLSDEEREARRQARLERDLEQARAHTRR